MRSLVRWIDRAALLVLAASAVVVAVLWSRVASADGRAAFAAVFGDLDRWASLLTTTLIATGVAVVVALLAGLPLAVLLFRAELAGRRVFLLALTVAVALPLHVVSGGWIYAVGLDAARGSAWIVGLVHAAAHLPLVVLLLGLALRGVDPDIERLAIVEGAHPLDVVLRVTLRAARPAIAATALLVALLVSIDYTVSDALVVRTYAEEVYTRFALDGDQVAPILTALPLTVLLAGALWALGRRALSGGDHAGEAKRPWIVPLRASRIPCAIASAILVGALLGAPLLFLLREVGDLRTLTNAASQFLPELRVTLACALATAAVIALLSAPLGWLLVGRGRLERRLTAVWVAVLLATPGALVGIGVIDVLNEPGWRGALYDSPAVLVVAWTIRFLPVGVLIAAAALRAVPGSLVFAARAEGCDAAGILREVALPATRRVTPIVFLVALVLSLGELPCSVLVAPPGSTTVAARYLGLLHYGMRGEAAALCILATMLVAVPACFAARALLRTETS